MAEAVLACADRRRGAPLTVRERAGALAAVGVIHVGFVALLIALQTHPDVVEELTERLTTIDVASPPPPPPPPDPRPTTAAEPTPNAPAPQSMPDIAAPAPIRPPIVFPPPVQVPPGEASSGSGSTGNGDAARGADGGNGTGGTGTGGGQAGAVRPALPLIRNGRWWRQPTAEDFNPPPNVRPGAPKSGWGEIVCMTARSNRLIDCVTRAEFPANSGFSEAMRVASPRFLYVATDGDGKPLIGHAVLVHLNFLEPKRR